MGPLIAVAIGLATKYIPGLIGKALNSTDAEAIAKTVTDSALSYTGLQDKSEALKRYEELLEQDKSEQQKLADQVMQLVQLEVDDTKDARHTFVGDKASDTLTYMIMIGNLPLIASAVGALIWLSTVELSEGKLTALSALIGGIISNFLQERQQVMNYRFGSTISDKFKKLTEKK